MPPVAFPYSTLVSSGFYPRKLRQLKPEYMVTMSPRYGDGGQDTSIGGTEPTRRWEIDYGMLTEAAAAVLDAHYESAQGEHQGFTFTDPRTLVVYANTKYESYERDHTSWRVTTQARRIVLIKRP